MAQSNKETYVFIPDGWACKALTIEHRFILGVIQSFNTGKKRFFLTSNEFAKRYHIAPRTYRRRLDELIAMGLIKHTATLANGRRAFEIDYCELDFLTRNNNNASVSNETVSNEAASNENSITPDALNDFINSPDFNELDY